MNIEQYFKIDGTYELKDGLYNVTGDVDLIKKVEKLPVKFGSVTGGFYCHSNYLTSLEGAPKQVGGHFNCSYNNLTSLEGAPKQVGGNFWCNINNLTSLKGCPISVGKKFYCDDHLKSNTEYRKYLIMKKLRQ